MISAVVLDLVVCFYWGNRDARRQSCILCVVVLEWCNSRNMRLQARDSLWCNDKRLGATNKFWRIWSDGGIRTSVVIASKWLSQVVHLKRTFIKTAVFYIFYVHQISCQKTRVYNAWENQRSFIFYMTSWFLFILEAFMWNIQYNNIIKIFFFFFRKLNKITIIHICLTLKVIPLPQCGPQWNWVQHPSFKHSRCCGKKSVNLQI